MSNAGQLGAICYDAETNFGEDVTTFATLRLPIKGIVDCSGLKHDKVDSGRTQQYRNEGTLYILTIQGGTFKTLLYLPGHGSTTSGATTVGLVETLLGKVFGNVTASAASGTTAASGGTASSFNTVASATFTAGGLTPVGAQGDGRGGGQFVPVATHVGTVMTPLVAIDAAPNTGDVIGSAVNIYPSETGFTVNSLRFLLQTANLCYEAHGCYPTAVTFSGLNPGEVPMLEITWSVAWWRYSTATFPSAVATEAFQAAANAAGSLFVNDVGTATRVKRTCRNFTLNYKLGMESLLGPGGVNQYQAIVGARRTVDDIRIAWMEDADAATTSPVIPGFGTGTTRKHVLYTLSAASGSRLAFYFPQVSVTTVGIQKVDKNINRIQFDGECNTGPTTTTDLTACAMRLAFA